MENFQQNKINQDFSQRITAIRFPLACFVIFIHFNVTEVNLAGKMMAVTAPLYVEIIRHLIANVWGGIAVPLFFIISGYLFAAKPKPAKVTVKSKFQGIVVPYILWTLITAALFFAAQSFAFTRPYFTQEQNIIRFWKEIDVIKAFFGRTQPDADYYHPLVYQFWYLRNLLVFFCISPLIKIAVQKIPFSYLALILGATILRLAGIFPDPFWIFPALFYFSLGFYAVRHIQGVLNALDSLRWRDALSGYAVFTAVCMYLSFSENPAAIITGFLNTILTILLAVKAAGNACKNEKAYSILSGLSAYSFWIYAAHAPFISAVVSKLSVQFFPMHGALILIQFFGTSLLCIVLLVCIGASIRKIYPKLFFLLTGGRI